VESRTLTEFDWKTNDINGQRCCELITEYLNLICNGRLPPNVASFVGALELMPFSKTLQITQKSDLLPRGVSSENYQLISI
jgi:hypothetical protein